MKKSNACVDEVSYSNECVPRDKERAIVKCLEPTVADSVLLTISVQAVPCCVLMPQNIGSAMLVLKWIGASGGAHAVVQRGRSIVVDDAGLHG